MCPDANTCIKKKARRRRLPRPVFGLRNFGVLATLATGRKRDKIASRRKAFLEMAPLNALAEVTETTEEFRRVKVEGVLEAKTFPSIEIGPKVRTLSSEISSNNNEKRAIGHDVITPMRERTTMTTRKKTFWWWPFHSDERDDATSSATVALVNRGFAERGSRRATPPKKEAGCV